MGLGGIMESIKKVPTYFEATNDTHQENIAEKVLKYIFSDQEF